MKIKELKIEGFKSIGEIRISDPNPFSVFVGANASGKSNIFEAIEFLQLCNIMSPLEAIKLFGNISDILNQVILSDKINFEIDLDTIKPLFTINFSPINVNNKTYRPVNIRSSKFGIYDYNNDYSYMEKKHFDYAKEPGFNHFINFTRLFTGKITLLKRKIQDDSRLALDSSNLEKVLKRILKNENQRGEILEILQLLIPGFENIEIRTEELSSSDNLLIYEESLKMPLTKHLISDGTFNLVAIIAAIFQSEKPQFLCIEEPENGLNPKVVKQLVKLFREKCKENGHFIWLNTHSQTLVEELTPEEIILVDKKEGLTQIKQIKGMNLHGMKMDEALFTNVLGGGIPW